MPLLMEMDAIAIIGSCLYLYVEERSKVLTEYDTKQMLFGIVWMDF
jgi:hypothetical protein